MRATKLLFLTSLLAGVLPSAFAGPIHDAAEKGDIVEVRRLLDAGADINGRDKEGHTVLLKAAYFADEYFKRWSEQKEGSELKKTFRARHDDCLAMVRFLSESGAEIDGTDNMGRTALSFAVSSRDIDLVALLIGKGADVNGRSVYEKNSVLAYAVYEAISCRNISTKNTVNLRDANNAKIERAQYFEIVRLLLGNKANLNVKIYNDSALLECASKYGDIEMAELLLANGADINQKGANGKTALAGAINREMVDFLLNKGAGAEITDDRGFSPMQTNFKMGPYIAARLNKQLEYAVNALTFDCPETVAALIEAETTRLPDWLASATVQQKVALLTDVKKQLSRATAAIDRLNGEATDAIVKKQDAAPYRARVGQIKAYINVLNEIKAILEQS